MTQNEVNKEGSLIIKKSTFCVYQGERNVSFSETFAYILNE